MTHNGVAPSVIVESDITNRDEHGRFVTGNIGGPGRPRGSRNLLSEAFIEDCRQVWEEGGIEALRKVMQDEPAAFVRAIAGLMPRDILLGVSDPENPVITSIQFELVKAEKTQEWISSVLDPANQDPRRTAQTQR